MEQIYRHKLLYLQSTKAELSKQNHHDQKHKRVEIAQHRVCYVISVLMQLYFSLQRVDGNQLKIINGKKRFSLITLLAINVFS